MSSLYEEDDYKIIEFSNLLGKTITNIKVIEQSDSDYSSIHIPFWECEKIMFTTTDNEKFIMCCDNDLSCCGGSDIVDISGSIKGLIGQPILFCESTKKENIDTDEFIQEIWVFYKIKTIKEDVTIQWFGQSNGYYNNECALYKMISNKASDSFDFLFTLKEKEMKV